MNSIPSEARGICLSHQNIRLTPSALHEFGKDGIRVIPLNEVVEVRLSVVGGEGPDTYYLTVTGSKGRRVTVAATEHEMKNDQAARRPTWADLCLELTCRLTAAGIQTAYVTGPELNQRKYMALTFAGVALMILPLLGLDKSTVNLSWSQIVKDWLEFFVMPLAAFGGACFLWLSRTPETFNPSAPPMEYLPPITSGSPGQCIEHVPAPACAISQ